jgi:Holliday junction resolvase-like predicted endonuclease
MRRAQAGEEAAEILLEELGYTIVSRQESRSWPIIVDGEEFEASVRADLVVTRDDETWIAEVKTGDTAPNPLHPATRRQLLEYLFVFDPDGILLVDVEMGDVMEVAFPVG